jgi:hypothetical protein
MSEIECEFCGEKLQTKSSLNLHRAKTKACIEFQIKKLGKPLSEINKEKKAAEEARIAKKKAEKTERDKKKAEKDKKKAEKEAKIEAEKEKSRKAAEKAYREAEEEISKKANEKEIVTESDDDSEIDENAEIPLSSSSEDESSSSESEEEEQYKVKEQATVKEEFDNIENYQRTNPSRLNNLFKKKSTTVKTEIIREDQPPEVHKRKIEECLQPVKQEPTDCASNEAPLDKLGPVTPTIDIKALSEDINKKVNSSIVSLETKINSLIDIMGKVTVSISSLEKRMKSIEASVDIERDIERIMDDKLDDMFSITRKMLAEVESKSELLDIFRENMEDIVDKHYDLYKKFKYVKEDIEDMVYDKSSRRR